MPKMVLDESKRLGNTLTKVLDGDSVFVALGIKMGINVLRKVDFINHLLLHCEIATITSWSEVFAYLGLAWVIPKSVSDLLTSGRDIQGNS